MTRLSFRAALASAVLVVISCGAASAQSGRRPPARRPDPPPTATPAPETPAPAPAPESDAPKIPVSVAKFVSTFNLPEAVCDYVMSACLDRFRSAAGFSVLGAKDMNRKGAIELAKSGTETYVLLLDFSVDAADADRASMGVADLRNVVVAYTLFEPKTGKTRTAGRLYFTADRYYASRGRVLAPYGGIGTGRRGYTPDEAGHKVAEYVMASLALPAETTAPVPR